MARSKLFSPIRIKDIEFKNRIFVSPMCQYSSREGLPADWHLVHLGSRAVGGAALVMVEATAVSPEGRISPWDSGIWSDQHMEAFKPITAFITGHGAVPGIQLAHAGRKASTGRPWEGGGAVAIENGGWQTIAPGPVPFSENYPVPRQMSSADMTMVIEQFAGAARRALQAGFRLAEIHAAHGYLLHEFLSPLSNHRQDEYGGSLENRMRFPLEVVAAVRDVWPAELPLFLRISATDWADGGWDIIQSVQFAHRLKASGIDLVDCSSGGLIPNVTIPAVPGYQTPFAAEVREKTGILTGAVGMITAPEQAEHIIATGQADAVFLARQLLRDPYWPLHAARKLGVDVNWPAQYQRAKQ